jgi:cell filamentation protein
VTTRYDIDHLVEAQFEPGSRGRVLKNLLGIRRKREMDALETVKLVDATDWAIHHYSPDHRFTAADVGRLHRQWLGEIYPWAGEYRQVNIGKGGFAFAMAAQVPRLMDELDRDVLAANTPCTFDDRERLIEALAVTHCELVLIHPFRDGNGRIARLLSILMALQAGMPLLDFSGVKGKMRQAYFSAVQASMGRDYEPMKRIFRAVLRRSERAA